MNNYYLNMKKRRKKTILEKFRRKEERSWRKMKFEVPDFNHEPFYNRGGKSAENFNMRRKETFLWKGRYNIHQTNIDWFKNRVYTRNFQFYFTNAMKRFTSIRYTVKKII